MNTAAEKVLPYQLRTALWTHQHNAVAFAAVRPATLFDMGMGTGKTATTIALINQVDARLVLVVCPHSVIPAWKKQIEMHSARKIHVELLHTGTVAKKKERAAFMAEQCKARRMPLVLVINYESLWRAPFADWALAQPWCMVIADEAHKLKSPGGKASRYMSNLGKRAKRRLALTGTPLPQGPMDAYALYRFLEPSIFGFSFARFRTTYAVMGGFQNHQVIGYQRTDEFAKKFGSIRYHAARDVLDLPEAIHTERTFELTGKALKAYKGLEDDFYAQVDCGEVTVSNALSKLLRLQQLTSGYLPIDSDDVESVGQVVDLHTEKRDMLAEIFDELPADEPVVVFARFKRDLINIHIAAESAGRESSELSGSLKQLEEWQAGNSTVLAVQIGAGAEGIDLTRAAHAVFYSLGFSLAQYKQALARTHRPGQDRTCFYHHLIADGTVDRQVYKALANKEDVVRSILEKAHHEHR